MSIHTIKLKGPWTVIWRPDGAVPPATGEPQSVHLPADGRTLFGQVAGVARFERRFNRPTGLTAGHRVRIRFRDVSGLLDVGINDRDCPIHAAPDGSPFVDATDCLELHNRLSVDVRCDPTACHDLPTGLWQPVVIEIEEPEREK